MPTMDELMRAGLEYLASQTKEAKQRRRKAAQDAQQQYKAEKRERKKISQWYGQIGERCTLTLTVSKRIPYESPYGQKFIYFLSNQDGWSFKWFTASSELEEGETYRVKATIKNHEAFEGEKITLLTRCSLG